MRELGFELREGQKISSGVEPVDRLLAEGGLRRGTLVEWVSAEGSASGQFALAAAREACRPAGMLVVIDPKGTFYPLAAARVGIELDRMIVVRPAGPAETFWALEQALRCRGVAAVLSWLGPLKNQAMRRLQLAAEAGGGLGLFPRLLACRREPSWARYRFLVEPVPSPRPCRHRRRLRVELLPAGIGKETIVEFDDETNPVHLVASRPDAEARAGRRPARPGKNRPLVPAV